MDALWTPLLRRVYAVFALILVTFWGMLLYQHSPWRKERLYHRLLSHQPAVQAAAATALIEIGAEDQFVQALKSDSASVRSLAVQSLWDIWFQAAGPEAQSNLLQAETALSHGHPGTALEILDRVIEENPDFAEAWNQRAIVYWQMKDYENSARDCEHAIALNPDHFGAWHGLALCWLQQGDLINARHCLEVLLRIDPHNDQARTALKWCTRLLRSGTIHYRPRVDEV